MYLSFFHLKKQPFHITPDPEFLYLSPSHKEALAAIIYGIEQRKGFVAIIGPIGVGKTTILRSYLETAERKRLKIVYVFNANLTFEGLLKTIYQELGLRIESNDVPEMVNRLYEVLIEEYRQGNTVVLVVDEAQNMPVDTLENLRMISNLETSKDKLIQIVLVGQLEFAERLNIERLRQLKQRVAIRSTILPLTKDESFEYVKFRLHKAGSNPASVFTVPALKRIVRKSEGIPRVINILCDNALITGFGYQRKPVTKKIVKEIIRDFDGSKRSFLARWWLPGTAALAALIVGAAWLLPPREVMLNRLRMLMPREQRVSGDAVKEVRPAVVPAAKKGQNQSTRTEGEAARAPAKHQPAVVTKNVTPGDTLSKLAREVYGNSDDRVMKLVRESNPQIADPNLIRVGSKLTFPAAPVD